MPRQNLNQETTPNPSKMFAEWKDGIFRYYDKQLEKNVELPSDFTFIVIDELTTVKGWNDPSQSGIYSNEVRNTKTEKLLVKSFKGGKIAEGLYEDIKPSIVAAGGKYCKSVYIAYKDGELKMGNIQFSGASLGAWFDFVKENKSEIYKQAVKLVGKLEDKKGSVKFSIPVFKLVPISKETDDLAGEIQKELQEYFESYFKFDIDKELEVVKSEVEQQTEVLNRTYDKTASFAPDNEDIEQLPF
jgi:hypothetical protein